MKTLPLGSEVNCRGFNQWGMYLFEGVVEDYTYRPYHKGEIVTGYKIRKYDGTLDSVWLRDAELT